LARGPDPLVQLLLGFEIVLVEGIFNGNYVVVLVEVSLEVAQFVN